MFFSLSQSQPKRERDCLGDITKTWYIVNPMARPWSRKKMKRQIRESGRNRRRGRRFWDKEYQNKQHLALSANPSEDLVKFTRWLSRQYGGQYLNRTVSVLDLGCGNGRNLIHLVREFGCRGVGFDISHEAIAQAKRLSEKLLIEYQTRSIADPIPLPDGSQAIVLDMMTSHFLKNAERTQLLNEIVRVLRPDGWLFFKTFLRDEDQHAERLLREHPAGEEGSYIHPIIGVLEHVSTEDEIRKLLEAHFIIHKITKSHRHTRHGKAWKRRSISVYAQKK
jgi:SAM-dependent methyltransferase